MLSAPPGFAPAPAMRVWGDRPSALADDYRSHQLRVDLTDQTVLHVGCDAGAFCLDALRRGATHALGIDPDPDRIRMARSYASLAELPARFAVMDPEEQLPEGRYDIVYCSDISEYGNPSAMVEKLARLVDDRLVIEFEGPQSPGAASVLDRIGAPRPRAGRDSWPAIVVEDLRGRAAHSFLTPRAVETMLLHRSARFASVEIEPLGNSGRYRATATRRIIGRLVIVAAAGRVESTRLVDNIRSGEASPELMERLDMTSVRNWVFAPQGPLPPSGKRITPGVVYGFDLHTPMARRAGRFGRGHLVDLLDSAAEVTFVTAWTDPEVLQERGRKRVGQASRTLRRLERRPGRVLARSAASLARQVAAAFPRRWTPARLRRFLGRARSELDLEQRIARGRATMRHRQMDDRAYRQTDEHLLRFARWLDFCARVDADDQWIVDNTHERWSIHSATDWGHLLVERARRRDRGA